MELGFVCLHYHRGAGFNFLHPCPLYKHRMDEDWLVDGAYHSQYSSLARLLFNINAGRYPVEDHF